MFCWIADILFGRDDDHFEQITEDTQPGTRVVVPQTGLEGTVSSVEHVDGAWYARVVFTGVRRTWIEVLHIGSLQAT